MSKDKKPKWYILHIVPGRESKVLNDLKMRIIQNKIEDSIFGLFLPIEHASTVIRGKKTKITKKLMPGYIFMQVILSDKIYEIIQRLKPSVLGFLGGKKPEIIPESQINSLYDSVEEKNNLSNSELDYTYKVGDVVKIMEGAFQDFTAVIERVDNFKKTIDVSISILRRETKVMDIEFSQASLVKGD